MDEKKLYLTSSKSKQLYKIFTRHPDYIFYKAVKINRKYRKAKENNNKILLLWYGFKANRYASKYNLELYGTFGEKFRIWHGNIIINSKTVIGNNVQLHGNNCIGQKDEKAPVIGNNVDIGYGTTIIGNIKIADDIVIGANSLVNKSFEEKGVVIAGCPARIIKKK